MNIKPLILIVEDDKPIKKFMKVSLEAQGYKCIETEFGNSAIALIFSNNPDIIILDLGLPDIDGLNVIERVRESTKARIIVVSARGHESEKVEALDKGADDYLTKPFSVAELLARVRVALRHFNGDNNLQNSVKTVFVVKDLKIDFEKRRVTILHEEVHLTPMEYKLIELMSRYAGRVLTHKYIVDEIWGSYFENETQSLRVFMANIRRKIEKNPAEPQYIITEVGVGYRLIDE
jgi:two-component system KDP operon response regulator KdpE